MNTLRVEHGIFIGAPAEEIFAYISNLENLACWSSAISSVQKISSGEKLAGTTVRCTIQMTGRRFDTTYEVVECVPSRYIVFKSISSVAPSLICFQCDQVVGLGTHVSVEETITFTAGFLDFDELIIKSAIRQQVVKDLQKLKELFETIPS